MILPKSLGVGVAKTGLNTELQLIINKGENVGVPVVAQQTD